MKDMGSHEPPKKPSNGASTSKEGRPKRSTRGNASSNKTPSDDAAKRVKNQADTSKLPNHNPLKETPTGSDVSNVANEKNTPQQTDRTDRIGGGRDVSNDAPQTSSSRSQTPSDSAQQKRSTRGASNGATGRQDASDGQDKGAVTKGIQQGTSNLTGVDYSDKSLKDQAEHQVADLVLDATPGLGQANSARKALKSANKQKNDALHGGERTGDAVDKVEDGVDKVFEAGIKGGKIAGAGAVGGWAIGQMMMVGMMLKAASFVKGAAVGIMSKIMGMINAMISSVAKGLSAITGLAASISQSIVAGVMAVTIGASSIFGGQAVYNAVKKTDDSSIDGGLACLPTTTTPDLSDEEQAGYESDEIKAKIAEYEKKVYSLFKSMGAQDEFIAGMLGNFYGESNVDPTSIETIYTEPHRIGERKKDAIAKDFLVDAIAPAYAAKYPAIKYVGIGLGQWTNERQRGLLRYADAIKKEWYDIDVQLGYMISKDDKTRVKYIKKAVKANYKSSDEATDEFKRLWEGLTKRDASWTKRLKHARQKMFDFKKLEVDKAYADSILSDANVDVSGENHIKGAYQQDDGCNAMIKDHYANTEADGTGRVSGDIHSGQGWLYETLPEELKKYAVDPKQAGLGWKDASGWQDTGYPGQCVAFATSYFTLLYPDWSKHGPRPRGNGGVLAGNWAKHYGQPLSKTPSKGAIFSNDNSGAYGHTGIVSHVFEDESILIVEQNVKGLSGDDNGETRTWNYRYLTKASYSAPGTNMRFFKPRDAKSQFEKK